MSGKPAERQPRPRRPVITDAETEGVRDRNIIWKLRGKNSGRETVRDSFTEHAPIPLPPLGAQLCQGCFPRGQDQGRVGSTEAHNKALPVSRSSLSPRALSAGTRLYRCCSFSHPQ